jgi:hypothetical protein
MEKKHKMHAFSKSERKDTAICRKKTNVGEKKWRMGDKTGQIGRNAAVPARDSK